MATIDGNDRALIDRVGTAGGDPHLVAGMVGAFRGSLGADLSISPVYRTLLQWYSVQCRAARLYPATRKRPNRKKVNDKFCQLLADHMQTSAN